MKQNGGRKKAKYSLMKIFSWTWPNINVDKNSLKSEKAQLETILSAKPIIQLQQTTRKSLPTLQIIFGIQNAKVITVK